MPLATPKIMARYEEAAAARGYLLWTSVSVQCHTQHSTDRTDP